MQSSWYHTVIFVQTNAEGKGRDVKVYVTSNIVAGMHYESTPYVNSDMESTLFLKELIGYTKVTGFMQQQDAVLGTL